MCFSGIQVASTWVPTQPIHNLIDHVSLVFDLKFIFLSNESPSCQFPYEPVKLHEPLQWLVICHQSEWATQQITLECGHGLHNY
jgi:hypothetical protein